ncbi:MAG: hypothetical protein KIT47_20940, partial [Rhodoferax sp.]|nr:hypothetical protein [Rhodoferax sp.]
MTRFLSFALITLAAATGFAGTQIRLSQGSFNPALHGSLEQTLAAQAVALGSVASEWILQFDHSPTEADKKALRARGFEVLGYI